MKLLWKHNNERFIIVADVNESEWEKVLFGIMNISEMSVSSSMCFMQKPNVFMVFSLFSLLK